MRRSNILFALWGAVVGCGVGSTGAGPTDGGGDGDVTQDVIPFDASDHNVQETGSDSTVDSGVDTGMEGDGDASGGGDGDAAPCNGVLCSGSCMPWTDCTQCAGATLLCQPTGVCTSDCSGCTDMQGTALNIQCFVCDSAHMNPFGTCQYDDAGAYCLNGFYAGQYFDGGLGYQCACDEAGACPAGTQVCANNGVADFCYTCGQAAAVSLEGGACSGGGTCDPGSHRCQ